jgi:hypothetical protein
MMLPHKSLDIVGSYCALVVFAFVLNTLLNVFNHMVVLVVV